LDQTKSAQSKKPASVSQNGTQKGLGHLKEYDHTFAKRSSKKVPSYAVFAPDRERVVGGLSLAQGQADFDNAFVQCSAFLAKHPANQDGPTFVDVVLATLKNLPVSIPSCSGLPSSTRSTRTDSGRCCID
jgi:hypothetical protein